MSIGLAIINLFNFLGASVFVTVGQALLTEGLVRRLRPILPDLDTSTLADGGATTLRTTVPADQLPAVLNAYNDSMKSIWYLLLGLACLIFVAGWGMEWKSVKQSKPNIEGAKTASEEEMQAMNEKAG